MIPSPVKASVVAIVGNPNAGKTSLFNALTGASQKVANYPGVTVERVSANLSLGETKVEVVDIPGLYSLSAQSEDERVAVEAILDSSSEKPDLLVCVINAANLERNLFLFTQLASHGLPLLVVLTMEDQLQKEGKEVDKTKLSNLLGVEVVPVIAHKGLGIADLKKAIEANLANPKYASTEAGRFEALENKVDVLHERLSRFGLDTPRDLLRKGLLAEDSGLREKLSTNPELEAAFDEIKAEVVEERIGKEREVTDRYKWTKHVTDSVVSSTSAPKKSLSKRLDKILTHRFWGLIIFVGIMYLVFQSIYTFASPLMDFVEECFGLVGDKVGGYLEPWPTMQSLVVDGLIAGVGGAVVFLPQILILFFFIAVLEGSGYLARAAFLMDRLLNWCGLNGRAFIPLLSSYACAIPGIMAARVMPDAKSRLATILVAPLMSCSARLPVYILLIGTFIEPRFGAPAAGFTLFAMHFLGLFVAIPIVYFLKRGVLKGKQLPFLLELPPYQLPKWRDIWLSMFFRGKIFLKTAGTIIVFMSVIIWALSYFPRSEVEDARYMTEFSLKNPAGTEEESELYVAERRLENSYLGRAGRFVEPVFVPAGFDWRITTSILAAFPAREVVVSTLGVIFSVGDVESKEGDVQLKYAIEKAKWPDGRPLFTHWTAIGLMVFFALCAQCMATLATVKRETNSWKWPLFMFVYMSTLAYIGAVFVNWLGKVFGG